MTTLCDNSQNAGCARLQDSGPIFAAALEHLRRGLSIIPLPNGLSTQRRVGRITTLSYRKGAPYVAENQDSLVRWHRKPNGGV
jgi:hypothetical protein